MPKLCIASKVLLHITLLAVSLSVHECDNLALATDTKETLLIGDQKIISKYKQAKTQRRGKEGDRLMQYYRS